MGHASTRAALIYQHSTARRDRVITDSLSGAIQAERGRVDEESGAREVPTIWHGDGTPEEARGGTTGA